MHASTDSFVSSLLTLTVGLLTEYISSIWELLTPTHDHLSDINLGLLMKLISVDVRYFQACVFKIFEDANWEVR